MQVHCSCTLEIFVWVQEHCAFGNDWLGSGTPVRSALKVWSGLKLTLKIPFSRCKQNLKHFIQQYLHTKTKFSDDQTYKIFQIRYLSGGGTALAWAQLVWWWETDVYSSSAGALAILKYVYSEFGVMYFAFCIVYSGSTGAAAIVLTNAYVLCSVLRFLYFVLRIAYPGFPDVIMIFIWYDHQHHFMPMHVMAMEKFMIPVEICNEEPVCGGSTHDPPTVPPHH